MNKKWILLLFPLSLSFMATEAFGQTSLISNAVAGSDNQQSNSHSFQSDTTIAPVPADSAFANVQNGWQKAPGQMPIYFFALPPNSMPILTLPLVDEKMIIPIKSENSDSLTTSNQDDE